MKNSLRVEQDETLDELATSRGFDADKVNDFEGDILVDLGNFSK